VFLMEIPVVVIVNKQLSEKVFEIAKEIAEREKVKVIKLLKTDDDIAIITRSGLGGLVDKEFHLLAMENPAIYISDEPINTKGQIIMVKNEKDLAKLPELLSWRIKVAKIYSRLPRIDCKQCGRSGCYEFALDVAKGKATIKDCVTLKSEKSIVLKVKGKVIPLNPWVMDLYRNTILVMISALKGVKIEGDEKLVVEVK